MKKSNNHEQPTEACFRFAPDILRRLGEELNPSLDQGIIELVKNAYDADARSCQVELINTDRPGGSVHISDNGDGMAASEIADRWLVLGSSTKSTTHPTRLGRIPAGSKGLGRLAALRMGSRCTLISRPKKDPGGEYHLSIDWDRYDQVQVVEDVVHTINRFSRPAGRKDGSEIRVENLKDRVGRIDVKRLARAMILLADPFGDDPEGFKPILVAPEFSDLEALVKKRYFEEGEYHLAAELDQKGRARAAVLDWRGRELFTANHDELAVGRDKNPYECPSACLDLWVFLLNKTSFSARRVTLGEVRSWLQEFGGVHLYQNGLRVNPYGNPGNDWLDMNLRRAQSPEERPSTNTAIGRIRLEDTANVLVQKTDRSGIIEVPAFQELKAFATDAMEWMARRRLSIAEERRRKERSAAPERSRRSKRKVDKAIEKLPEDRKAEVKEAFAGYQRDQEREVRQLRKEVQLYRTLSTAGITAATFAHESEGNPIKVITQSIGALERRSKKLLGKNYDEQLKRPIESVKRATASLAVLGTATLKLVDHEKRRLSRVDVHTVILEVLEMFKPFLDGRDVLVETRLASGNPFLRGSEAAIESIVTNLLNNSLAALEGVTTKDRIIRVVTEIESGVLIIHVLDNGPGIEGINKKDIWLPGHTTRRNGTGLGLTIVRDSVIDLGGKVDAIEHGELDGAEIVVELPLLGG